MPKTHLRVLHALISWGINQHMLCIEKCQTLQKKKNLMEFEKNRSESIPSLNDVRQCEISSSLAFIYSLKNKYCSALFPNIILVCGTLTYNWRYLVYQQKRSQIQKLEAPLELFTIPRILRHPSWETVLCKWNNSAYIRENCCQTFKNKDIL